MPRQPKIYRHCMIRLYPSTPSDLGSCFYKKSVYNLHLINALTYGTSPPVKFTPRTFTISITAWLVCIQVHAERTPTLFCSVWVLTIVYRERGPRGAPRIVCPCVRSRGEPPRPRRRVVQVRLRHASHWACMSLTIRYS